jgi:hypothetical protein
MRATVRAALRWEDEPPAGFETLSRSMAWRSQLAAAAMRENPPEPPGGLSLELWVAILHRTSVHDLGSLQLCSRSSYLTINAWWRALLVRRMSLGVSKFRPSTTKPFYAEGLAAKRYLSRHLKARLVGNQHLCCPKCWDDGVELLVEPVQGKRTRAVDISARWLVMEWSGVQGGGGRGRGIGGGGGVAGVASSLFTVRTRVPVCRAISTSSSPAL